MNKETISDKQGIILITMFIIGTSSLQPTGLEAKQDVWLGIIIGALMAFPIFLIYARLHSFFPDKNMFDIIEFCFGKFFGKIIMFLFFLFMILTASEVLINFGFFINTVSFPETPTIIPTTLMIFLCAWIVKEGINTMGRWAELFVVILLFFLLVTTILLIPNMDINNTKPIIANGPKPIFKGAFAAFMFPYTQALLFSMAFSPFKKKKSNYKVYTFGLFFGTILILIVSLTNILVLGVNQCLSFYHPTYFSVARIQIGDFLQRIEASFTIIFIIGAFIKISIYLLGSSRSFSRIFECKDYRFIVIPTALLILILSHIITDSIMEFYEWTSGMWNYFALIFQVFLPIFIWIIAEIKNKLLTK